MLQVQLREARQRGEVLPLAHAPRRDRERAQVPQGGERGEVLRVRQHVLLVLGEGHAQRAQAAQVGQLREGGQRDARVKDEARERREAERLEREAERVGRVERAAEVELAQRGEARRRERGREVGGKGGGEGGRRVVAVVDCAGGGWGWVG